MHRGCYMSTPGKRRGGVIGYSDADWAGNLVNRKSRPGYCFKLSDDSACISWSSKNQSSIATSTAEAELNASFSASHEMIFLAGILE